MNILLQIFVFFNIDVPVHVLIERILWRYYLVQSWLLHYKNNKFLEEFSKSSFHLIFLNCQFSYAFSPMFIMFRDKTISEFLICGIYVCKMLSIERIYNTSMWSSSLYADLTLLTVGTLCKLWCHEG